jgi:hypothetical protein
MIVMGGMIGGEDEEGKGEDAKLVGFDKLDGLELML